MSRLDIKFTRLTPFKRCVLQNFPFIEEDFDALTNYGLLCKIVEYLNQVIASQNGVLADVSNFEANVTENFEALRDSFVELKAYVDNFFENLDVQDEINNKLDAMAEAGTLSDIISQYLNSTAVFGYDKVADMKNAENLVNGSYARTLGYYDKNDGGGALYKIRTITNDDVIDEGSIIEMNDEQNQLVAELIVENVVNVKQFGAYGDGTHDDTTAIQKCLTKYDSVYLLSGTYLISQSLKLKENNSLIGESKSNTSLTTNEAIILIEPKDNYIKNISIENISLLGNYHATSGICLYKTANPDLDHTDTNIKIKNVYVNRCTNWCVMLGRSDSENSLPNTVVDDLTIEQFTGGGLFLSSRCTDSMFGNVFVGGGSVGTKPNIRVEGYNLHFNNCKSYYSGKSDNHQDAWYFDGAAVISGEIEAQDSYKYGVELYQSKYINLSIITDKCGEISSNYPAIYINDSGFMNLNISCSNAENNNLFNTKSCVKLNKSNNINMDIVKQNNVDYLFDNTGEFPNTSDIKFSLNGNEVIDVTPVFDTQNYNSNGIEATTIGENKILISGTATADVSLALKGSYGSSTVLSHIPSGNVVNALTNGNTQFQIFYDRTTVWTSTAKQNIKATTANIDITGLVLKIPNGTVINAVVTPKILITSNS